MGENEITKANELAPNRVPLILAGKDPENIPRPLPPPKSKKGFFRTLLKIFIIFFLLFLMILVVGTIAINYFLSSEKLRPMAEEQLTKTLKMPVGIEGLELSLLTGVNIQNLSLGEGKPIIRIGAVVLDYDLTELLAGKLVINQVLVDRPEANLVSVDGVWNFQPLLELGGPKKPQPEPEPKEKPSFDLPSIPLAVNLKEFAIRDIQLDLDMDGNIKAQLKGLSLLARGILDLDNIDVNLGVTLAPPKNENTPHNLMFYSNQGQEMEVRTMGLMDINVSTKDLNHILLSRKLDLKNNVVWAGGSLPSPNVSSELDLDVALKEQILNLNQFVFSLAENNRIKISGNVTQFLSGPVFKIKLHEALFRIGDLLKWAKAFVPDTQGEGEISVTDLNLSGSLPGFQPDAIQVGGGKIELKGIFVNHPPLSAKVEGLDASVNLHKIHLKKNVPQNLEAGVNLTLKRVRFQDLTLKGLTQVLRISAAGPNLPETELSFATKLDQAQYSASSRDRLNNLNVEGKIAANIASGDIQNLEVDYQVDSLVKGSIRGNASNFGKNSFQVNQSLNLKLARAKDFIPPEVMDQLQGLKIKGDVDVNTTVTGKLDSEFKPLEAKVQGSVQVKGLNASLAQPDINVDQLNATVTFPAEFHHKNGVKVPTLDLDVDFKNVKALGVWDVIAGSIQTKTTMGSFFNLESPDRLIPITNTTKLRIDGIQGAEPKILLAGLGVDSSVKVDVSQADARNITLKGSVSFDRAEGMDQFKTGKLSSTFKVDVNDKTLQRTQATVKAELESPVFAAQGQQYAFPSLTLESRSRQNLKSGEIHLQSASLKIPSLVQARVRANAKNWGETFDVSGRVSGLNLKPIWAMVPENLKTGLEGLGLAGNLSLSLDAKGTLPKEFDIKKGLPPIMANAGMRLQNAFVSWPDKGLRLEKAETTARLNVNPKAVTVSGAVSLGKLFLTEILGEAWLDPQFNFNYVVKDLNKLLIRKHRFTIKNRGVVHTLSGAIDGLKPFIIGEAKPEPAELIKGLKISLATKNSVQLAKATANQQALLGEQFQASGSLRSDVSVNLTPKKELKLNGNVSFDQFDLALPGDIKVNKLQGSFPFNKKLLLDRKLLTQQKGKFQVAQKGFFSQLRDFSKYKNILTIDSLQFQQHEATHIGFDILFDNNQLMIEKFLLDILGGSIAGNLFIYENKKIPTLKFFTEFAGLDFDKLVGTQTAAGQSESEIDGHIQFGFEVDDPGKASQAPISLGQIETEVAITRIGAETLDRVLLFIDPEESKPAIVDIRSKLKLASPHKILVKLENGNLNVEAWLKNKVFGDIMKAPALKRVPAASLKKFKKISGQLQALLGLSNAMQYLAAKGIEFDENNNIVFY